MAEMGIRNIEKILTDELPNELYEEALALFRAFIGQLENARCEMGRQLPDDPSCLTHEQRQLYMALANTVNKGNSEKFRESLKRFIDLTTGDFTRAPTEIRESTCRAFGEVQGAELYAPNLWAFIIAFGSTEFVEVLARLVGGMFVPLKPIANRKEITLIDALKECSNLNQKFLEMVDDKNVAPLTAEMLKTELASVMVHCATLVLKELKGK